MRKLDKEFVRKEFEKEGYILLDEYVNARTKMRYICPNGHEHSIQYNSFKNGNRCPYCAKCKVDFEVVKKAFKEEGWELLENKYINCDHKMKCKCNHGHDLEVSWTSFRVGYRCSICSKNKKLTIEQVKEEFEKIGWKLLTTEYINNKQQLDYICEKGHKHHICWNDFQQGYRCPYCNFYKGEKEISLILDEYNIEYKTQYMFEDCRYERKLKFDFYIPSLNVCIEFDGGQHFKPIEWFGGEERFKIQQKCDQIKNDYCKNKGIRLIRIPYKEYRNKNIKNILKQELNLE